MTHTTPAQRAAALSRLIHDAYLSHRGSLPIVAVCTDCQAISGLLTGLVRMARELPTKAEYIEALVAECAETLDLIEPEPATSEQMAEHTTHTRVSLMGTAR